MTARDLIEPAARREDLEKRDGGFVYESEAATSIAISLKRIADLLDTVIWSDAIVVQERDR